MTFASACHSGRRNLLARICLPICTKCPIWCRGGVGPSTKRRGWDASHSKNLVIYKDLQEHRGAAIAHPIVRALAGQAPATEPTDPGDEGDLYELATQPEVFPVLPADSSQTQVLVQARHGHNLMVYSPPALVRATPLLTSSLAWQGLRLAPHPRKSQAIANLFAQFVRDSKRVLFVSEKMAALRVVDERL